MTCNDLSIKELIPAYQGKMLSSADTEQVEKHLAACEDCTQELKLLGMLASEPVPDPGDAFWAAMPGKIFREIRSQEQQKAFQWFPFGMRTFILPRRIWAASAVLLLIVIAAFLYRPATSDFAHNTLPENGSSYEDPLAVDPVDIAELTNVEIDSVDQWATGELASLQDDITDMFRASNDISLDDRLAELNSQELEKLSRILDDQEEG